MSGYRVYTVKLFQDKKNDEFFLPRFEVAKFLWNASISIIRKEYRKTGKQITKYELQRRLTKIRQGTKEEFIRQLPVCASDAVTDELYSRIKDYNTKKKQGKKCSFPNYKRECSCYTLKLKGYQLKDKMLILGWHNKFRYHDDYSPLVETKNIKQIKIKKDNLGDYWVHCYVEEDMASTKERNNDGEIAMDIGFETFLTFNDGSRIDWPIFFKEYAEKQLSLDIEYGNNFKDYEKKKDALTKIKRNWRKMSYRRKNFYWETANKLCSNNKYIYMEDLDYEKLYRAFGKKARVFAFGEFVNILNESAVKYGTEIITVHRFFPSSKLCSNCGHIKENLTLNDRQFICPNCGLEIDRDFQAAINIFREGKRIRIKFRDNKSTIEE